MAILAETAGTLGEEFPAAFAGLPALAGGLELVARPEDGAFGGGIEALRVEHGALVVVTEQDELALHDHIDALARVGAIADHVAQAIGVRHRLGFDVAQHRLKCFQITMDIADNRLHKGLSRNCRAAGRPDRSLMKKCTSPLQTVSRPPFSC